MRSSDIRPVPAGGVGSKGIDGSVAGLGEFELIRRLAQIVEPSSSMVGIGDDCAVIPGELLLNQGHGSVLVSTDTMIEGRHFRVDFSSPFEVGTKLLLSNASDIAAMGGVPLFAVISTQLTAATEVSWLEDLYRGVKAAADRFGISILGGDTTRAAYENSFTLTITGSVQGQAVMRKGAAPGDDIWVTGRLGLAQLGFELLCATAANGAEEFEGGEEVALAAITRHRCGEARVEAGQFLQQRKIPSAMLDVSDGLIQDLSHITSASDVSAVIDLASVPLPWNAPSGTPQRAKAERQALAGGDDYELLFTADRSRRVEIDQMASSTGVAANRIGQVVETQTGESAQVLLRISDGSQVSAISWCGTGGYKHF
jgi:thiamine-monophosphate kinase